MKIAKGLWIGTCVTLLFVTLYGFDGKSDSDIAILLAWYGLLLSFPGGLLVSLVHSILYDGFSIVVETSYLSLALDWLGFFVIGYLQWFKFLPWLVRKWRG